MSFLPLVFLAAGSGVQEGPPSEVVEWIRENAIVVAEEPGPPDTWSLAKLLPRFGDAKLVALGEGTHGTREFFQAKDRLLRLLVAEGDLCAILWESDFVPVLNAERLLSDPAAEVSDALDQLRGPLWNTREVEELFTWLGELRARRAQDVRLVGIDIFDLHSALAVACEELRKVAPSVADEHRGRLEAVLGAALAPGGKEGLESALDSLDISRFRQLAESVSFLGEALRDHGGSWEGALAARTAEQRLRHLLQFVTLLPDLEPGSALGVFDRYGERSRQVADSAGLLLRFLEQYDEGFVEHVRHALSAWQSPSAAKASYLKAMSPGERHAWWEALERVRARLEAGKERWKRLAGEEGFHDARRASDSLLDWIAGVHELLRRTAEREIRNLREVALAENVSSVLDRVCANGRGVLWAHNFHVNRGRGPEGGETAGSLLSAAFADELVSVATTFGVGTLQARDLRAGPGDPRYRSFELGEPIAGSLEEALLHHGAAVLALDLRELPSTGPVSDWFRTPRPMRWIGNQYDERRPRSYYHETIIPEQFDLVLFFSEASRAQPTQGALERFSIEPL